MVRYGWLGRLCVYGDGAGAVFGDSLCFWLNLAVNLRLLEKIQSI